MSKYDAIYEELIRCKEDRLVLTYEQMDELISRRIPDEKLPKSARIYEPWWNNYSKNHTQCRAWLRAGWNVDMSQSELGSYIVFVRIE